MFFSFQIFDYSPLIPIDGFPCGFFKRRVVGDLLFQTPACKTEILVSAHSVFKIAADNHLYKLFPFVTDRLEIEVSTFLADIAPYNILLRHEETVEHIDGNNKTRVSRNDIRQNLPLWVLFFRQKL